MEYRNNNGLLRAFQ